MKRLALVLLFGVSACAHKVPGGVAVITSTFQGVTAMEERVYWDEAGDVRHEFVAPTGDVASVIFKRHDAAEEMGVWPAKGEFLPFKACPFVDALKVEELGQRTIAGYGCRSLRVRTAGRTFDVCLADKLPVKLGTFGALLEQLHAEGYPGFPLEVRDPSLRDVGNSVTVEEREVDASLFVIPASYTRMKAELPPCPKPVRKPQEEPPES